MDITELTFDSRDEFKRRNIAEKVIKLLKSDIDVSPMVIEGGWGTGKTEFCHKLINLMTTQNSHHLIYIDAFRADHANEPLLTVLAEVIKVLPVGESRKRFIEKALPALRFGLKTITKAGVSHLLRQDIADVVDDFDKEIQETADKVIDATVESLLKEHLKADKNLKTLQSALAEIAATKPIIIFVDELDRCRPNFAIDLLEIVKHTFDVSGVRFVLITNTKQLKAAINHCYGQSVDSQRYLDKFIKFTIALPAFINKGTQNENLASIAHYKKRVFASVALNSFKLYDCGTIRTVGAIIAANNLSLREVETIVRHLEIYVTLNENGFFQPNTIFGFRMLAIFTIAAYCINPELMQSILQKRLDAKEISRFLGVTSLSNPDDRRFEDTEIICFMLAKSAKYNSDTFMLPTEQAEKWEKLSAEYFRGGFWRNDEPITICINVIQDLIMG